MAQIVDPTTHTAFWTDEIVAKNVALQAIVHAENSEALQTIKTGIDSPFMVLFRPEFRLVDRGSENVQRAVSWGFFLLKKATNKQSHTEARTLKNDCHAIAEEIIGRLIYLNEAREFWGGFDENQVDYTEIGPVYDNHYGVQVFGQFITNKRIQHDATKWV